MNPENQRNDELESDGLSSCLSAYDIRPGNILMREFLVPYKLSRADLAQGTALDEGTVNSILLGKIELTVQLGAKLDAFLGTEDGYWHALQREYNAAQRRGQFTDIRDVLAPYLLRRPIRAAEEM